MSAAAALSGLCASVGQPNVIFVPASAPEAKIAQLLTFGSTVLLSTPSYALNLAETMVDMGVDPKDLSLKVGVFGAEPWSENMREEIQRALGIKAIDIYGLSEIIGPGVAHECECKNGLHINEDHFLVEVLHPETLEPVDNVVRVPSAIKSSQHDSDRVAACYR